MNGRCIFEGCYDDSPCARGEADKAKCESWNQLADAGADAPAPQRPEATAGRVPWNSHALGLRDLHIVSARGRPLLVGIVGPADAGKTTFLVLLYQLILRGQRLANRGFAGSTTLGAWESLAAWMRFTDTAPTFPPHTSSNDRMPGLLHLALRGDDDDLIDVLFTDAPGEWFSRWSINDAEATATGARWIIENADVFLVFADSERLAGPRKGAARGELQRLLERLGAHAKGRPVYLVWGKSDYPVPPGIKEAVTGTLVRELPKAHSTQVTKDDPASILEASTNAVVAGLQPHRSAAIREPVLDGSPFLAFRGHP